MKIALATAAVVALSGLLALNVVDLDAQQKKEAGLVIDARNREVMADDLLRDLSRCETDAERKAVIVITLKMCAAAERRRAVKFIDEVIAIDGSHQAAKALRGVEPWTTRQALTAVLDSILRDHMAELIDVKDLPKKEAKP